MDRFNILWGGYLAGSLTSVEEQELFDLLDTEEPRFAYQIEQLLQEGRRGLSLPGDEVLIFEAIQRRIQPLEKQRTQGRIYSIRTWKWVAASIIFIMGIGVYLWITHQQAAQIPTIAQQTADIAPGKEGAILTLADGSQVSLDTITTGVVALQGGVTAKVLDGRLLYEGTSKDAVYNTMSTPKGRQYPLTLPDGTKVWLNAESSIRYPTVFSGKERRVHITGEVYFEVAQNAAKPFHVNLRAGASIAVLGTQFNVNAYENEDNINATLMEGSIRVAVPAADPTQPVKQVVLQPGQQAQITSSAVAGNIEVITNVDIEKAMAWKNGLFNFNGLTFEEIMRQLERWYDINIVYENNKAPNKRLKGEMTRDVPLGGLLKNLEELGVRCKLQDRTLIISP